MLDYPSHRPKAVANVISMSPDLEPAIVYHITIHRVTQLSLASRCDLLPERLLFLLRSLSLKKYPLRCQDRLAPNGRVVYSEIEKTSSGHAQLKNDLLVKFNISYPGPEPSMAEPIVLYGEVPARFGKS